MTLEIQRHAQDQLEQMVFSANLQPDFMHESSFEDDLDDNHARNAETEDYFVVSSDDEDSSDFGKPKTSPKDLTLFGEFEDVQNTRKYKDMLELRRKLPAFKYRDRLLEKIRDNQVILISGGTGNYRMANYEI